MRSSVRHANTSSRPARRLGLIVNPIAGMGGPSAQKGTDSAEAARRAKALGVEPPAPGKTIRALRAMGRIDGLVVLAAAGAMGADLAREAGFAVIAVGAAGAETTRRDTIDAARAIVAEGVDLVMIAGGDGTVRDVLDAGLGDLPLIGVPTGVKMHSAIFATTPEAAGRVAAGYLADPAEKRLRLAEIMDVDEEALRVGRVGARLHGYARAPVERQLMQNCKSRTTTDDEAALDALARRIVAEMEDGRLYVLGCGETMRRVKRALGAEGTLLGVDVALNGRLIAFDVDQARLARLAEGARIDVVVGVTGGQGFVFGRGNQQIGPGLLARVGRDNVTIVSGQRKLEALDPPYLRVDTGDPAVDALFAGYMRVRTAPGRATIMRVAA